MGRGPFVIALLALAVLAAPARPAPPAAADGAILEMLGDVAVVAMDPGAFASLPREQKVLAWHLTQAALASHRVALSQNHRHDLAVWALVEALHARRQALDPDFALRLADYRRRIFLHRGVHDAWSEEKLVPFFTAQELEEQVRRAEAAGMVLAAEPSLAEIERTLLDPAVDPFRVNKTPGPLGDPIAAGSLNQYAPGLTWWDLQGFADRRPLNSRVYKDGGRLAEEPYRAGGGGAAPGLAARDLATTIAHLETAVPLAPLDEREALRQLVGFLRSGDGAQAAAHDAAWLGRVFPVDYLLGFVEQSSDPRQVKGLWQAAVAVRDPTWDPAVQRLLGAAPSLEQRLPFPPQYRRSPAEMRPRAAAAVDLVAVAGDALGFTFDGLTLPNDLTLRDSQGTKSWIATSALRARNHRALGDRLVQEFVVPESRQEAARCWRAFEFARAALREVVGHPSGKVGPGLRGDPRRLLAPYYSMLEEARAEAVAAYLLGDVRAVVLGLLPDAGCQQVATRIEAMQGLALLRNVPHGEVVQGDRLRAALLLQGWQASHGALRIVERAGRHYAQVSDSDRWREGLGALLAELQRIKATADRAAIEKLVDEHASRIDQRLRDEVLERVRMLGVPARIAVLPPVLEPIRDGPEVVDVMARPARGVDDVIEAFDRAR